MVKPSPKRVIFELLVEVKSRQTSGQGWSTGQSRAPEMRQEMCKQKHHECDRWAGCFLTLNHGALEILISTMSLTPKKMHVCKCRVSSLMEHTDEVFLVQSRETGGLGRRELRNRAKKKLWELPRKMMPVEWLQITLSRNVPEIGVVQVGRTGLQSRVLVWWCVFLNFYGKFLTYSK